MVINALKKKWAEVRRRTGYAAALDTWSEKDSLIKGTLEGKVKYTMSQRHSLPSPETGEAEFFLHWSLRWKRKDVSGRGSTTSKTENNVNSIVWQKREREVHRAPVSKVLSCLPRNLDIILSIKESWTLHFLKDSSNYHRENGLTVCKT